MDLPQSHLNYAPAWYIGRQGGFRDRAAIDLYTLFSPVGEHPAGSTVSGETLEKLGFTLPDHPRSASRPPLPAS